MYSIDVGTPADIEKVSALRRTALTASREISLHDISYADWSEIDNSSIVLTARLGAEIVSSMRMTIFRDVVGAQTFLEYPVARQPIAGPILAMSRAVTSPTSFNLGLMGALRYAYLTALKDYASPRIENVIAIVYQGAPRVNSMKRAGYVMIECDDHWDSEATLSAKPLIAVLSEKMFDQALAHTATEFSPILSECSFNWDQILIRFGQASII